MAWKSWKLWVLVVLAAVMVCVMAGPAAVAEDNGGTQIILTEEVEKVQSASMNVDPERSAELFVDRTMRRTRLRGVTLKGASLTGGSRNLYDRLRADIIAVANGAEDCDGSTVFIYDLSDIYAQTSFTEEELGAAIVVNNKITDTAMAAAAAKYTAELDFDEVTDCLMQDCVYELYWYDKTEGRGCKEQESYRFGAQMVDGGWVLNVSGQVTVSFAVSEDYAVITDNGNGTYSIDPYQVDVAKYGQAACQAAANARDIVSAHENESNYQRLLSYKDAICTATDYDDEAADQNNHRAYGNPWQLVWVFDGRADTKVVCEGYSKAFKYLNDLSSNDEADVILVQGTMTGATGAGPHMWNIVQMEDGANYLADITNCDDHADGSHSVGYPDHLFLKAPSDGSVEAGYAFVIGGSTVEYTYEGNHYGTDRITLAPYGYLDRPEISYQFSLPEGTVTIEEEAFAGTKAENVWIPDGCTAIEAGAFAGSGLKKIRIPASVTSIRSNAFPAGTIIYMPEVNEGNEALVASLRQHYTVVVIEK